ncbi:hypothetical protein HAX54_000593, partial [Datura stramonium]|nr:hypothetical protein [Datura stramonium]
STVEKMLPGVLPITSGSSVVHGSPPVVHRYSVGAASSFLLIPPLVSHLIFRVVV